MNIKKCVLLLIFTVILSGLQAYDTLENNPNLDLFLLPLKIPSGLELFFESVYNSRHYAEDFLPHNMSHLDQFLIHAKESGEDREYVKAAFSLFGQKLKGCSHVNAYTFAGFLELLPDRVGYWFKASPRDPEERKEEIRKILVDGLINQWRGFKDNPRTHIDTLSEKLLVTIDPDAYQEIPLEYLRQSIIRFIEIGLSKLVWDPKDRELWSNMNSIAEHVARLADAHIVGDYDDLNELAWSLTHRIRYFVDTTASMLDLDFFEEALYATQTNSALTSIEEQEELLETKAQALQRTLYEGLAKKQAFESGMITDVVPT
ncbi:hypothetical protein JW872_01320 [Candidatus Babeliales bacterium]|nr:hypothetical protein [Candidatus Babeliales bacterium]